MASSILTLHKSCLDVRQNPSRDTHFPSSGRRPPNQTKPHAGYWWTISFNYTKIWRYEKYSNGPIWLLESKSDHYSHFKHRLKENPDHRHLMYTHYICFWQLIIGCQEMSTAAIWSGIWQTQSLKRCSNVFEKTFIVYPIGKDVTLREEFFYSKWIDVKFFEDFCS